MPKRLQVLIVEDNPDDAALLVHELVRAGFDPEWHRVQTEQDFVQSLRPDLDLILSDFEMPQFNGLRALELLKEKGYDIPFIISSGTIGEETAVTAIKRGATDYLMKDRLARVGAAIRQALEQGRLRKNTREAEEALIESERKFRLLAENITDFFWITSPDMRKIEYASPAYELIWGRSVESLYADPHQWIETILPEDRAHVRSVFAGLMDKEASIGVEYRIQRPDGSLRWVYDRGFQIRDALGQVVRLTGTVADITERKMAEQQLNLLHICISNLRDIVLITEAESIDEPGPRIVFVNEAFERITGYTYAEAIGRSPRFLQGEKTDRRVLDEIRQALAQRRPIRRQVINYGKDGTEYWMDIDIVPIFDATGQCTHFAAIQRDITAEKRNEEQLLWKTALLEAQLNSTLDGILIVDGNGKKILQNHRTVDLWDIPREFAHEESHVRRLEWFASQVKDSRQFIEKVEYLYAHRDEISIDEIELINGKFLDRYSAPVLGNDGTYYGRIWVYHDITDRKRAEEQIAEQAAFLDKARDAILVRDLEGKILFWNQGAERMYGWTREEVLGRETEELIYLDRQKFEELNGLAISQGEWTGEIQQRTKEGQEITVEARWTLVRDNEGRPKSVLAINTDITERKKIEIQFMRAQRMESIGTLAGGIAHDLNNILAPIMMSIDILKTLSENPQAKRILETIEVSSRRGADIVRQVLSFARGLEGERIEVQPKHLLKDLENIIKDTFPKDIRLEFSVAGDPWTILGDPTQVHQVLLNLCVNARDAMPRGGILSIAIENCLFDEQYAVMNQQAKPGRYVQISVTDSGTGIPPDILEKIFEPFFTTKELHQGTGLGLSTVMAIVKSHEGIVNVYSEPGRGTTFKVYLPAAEVSPEGRKEQSDGASLPRGNDETILVIDDEASILTITGQTLQAFGYRVLTARDGAEAVAVYAEHKKDIAVVLTDMMMPIMDGPATIHALMRINPAVKIIAASGLNVNGDVAKVAGFGVKHFLTKPYTAGTLLKIARAILDESRSAPAASG